MTNMSQLFGSRALEHCLNSDIQKRVTQQIGPTVNFIGSVVGGLLLLLLLLLWLLVLLLLLLVLLLLLSLLLLLLLLKKLKDEGGRTEGGGSGCAATKTKTPQHNVGNKRMKRGGAGNPLVENALFEDMKQEDEKGWSR